VDRRDGEGGGRRALVVQDDYNARTQLSVTLNHAVRRGLLPRNPCADVRALPVERAELDYLRLDEIGRYVDACAPYYELLARTLIEPRATRTRTTDSSCARPRAAASTRAGSWPSRRAARPCTTGHEAALVDAGLRDMPLHALRHTAAAAWLATEHPLIFVQRQPGHRSITTTEEHYGHLEQSYVREAVERRRDVASGTSDPSAGSSCS
jgi:integrase